MSPTAGLLLFRMCCTCNIKHGDLREEASAAHPTGNLSHHLSVTGLVSVESNQTKMDSNFSDFLSRSVPERTLASTFSTWDFPRQRRGDQHFNCHPPSPILFCHRTEEKTVRLRSHTALSQVTIFVQWIWHPAKLSQVVLFSFLSKNEGRWQKDPAVCFFPHLSQQHLWLAYLKQHMLNPPGISSEIHRAGIPAAGELLATFLHRFLSPLTLNPSGL